MQSKFSHGKCQAFAFLLFVLLYVPCLAATGTAFRALGARYGVLLVVCQTILGWSLAVLFYQATVAHNPLWTGISAALLAALFLGLILLGKRKKGA